MAALTYIPLSKLHKIEKQDNNPIAKEFNFLGYSKNQTVTVSQNDPLPLKVLAMALEMQF